MLEKLFRRLGFIPMRDAAEALAVAWAEADAERERRLREERRFDEEYAASPDGLADLLDAMTGSVPVLLARHA